MTRQKPGEVPRGRARWPCGAVAAAGPPALDGTGRVGSARTTPGSRGDGPQTSGDLLAVSLSDFRDLRVPGLGWDSAKGGRAPGPGRADPRSVCAPRPDLSPGASPLCVLATRGRVRASGTPRPAPGAGPGDRGPCAAPSAPAAPPSLGVGTVPESGPVAAALRLLPSPALAPWPGRPGDRSACLHQANGSRFHPVGLRKRENRLKFDPFLRKAVRRGRRESGRGEGPWWPEALVARLPLQIDLLHSPPKRSICTHATSSLP